MIKIIANKTGKACHDFSMLKEGDKILIGFSGGKDSFVLIKILKYLKNKYPINFELKIITVNPNFDFNFENKIRKELEKIKEELNIDYVILNTEISKVIFNQEKIKKFRPCFMCSRLRRGILYDYAVKNGFNKIALGHNLNDAIETQMMNMFYSSKLSLLKPMYLAENNKIEIIRPLIYVDEDLILEYIKTSKFKPIKNICPIKNKKDSNREYFRKIIKKIKEKNPKITENCYHAFKNTKELNKWD